MNKKFILPALIFALLLIVSGSSNVYSQYVKNDSLYFCEEYKDSQEIGNSDAFYITKDGGYITVMLRTVKGIGVTSVDIVIERDVAGIKEKVATEPFDVEANWDYIFFANITFKEPGKYKVSAVKKNGEIIASAYVNMLLEK